MAQLVLQLLHDLDLVARDHAPYPRFMKNLARRTWLLPLAAALAYPFLLQAFHRSMTAMQKAATDPFLRTSKGAMNAS